MTPHTTQIVYRLNASVLSAQGLAVRTALVWTGFISPCVRGGNKMTEKFRLLPWQEQLLNFKGRVRIVMPHDLAREQRKALFRDHEEQRGKAYCAAKGVEYVGIQEFPGHESLVLFNLPSGTTKSATWAEVNEVLAAL